jgi:CBS domain-containing protein
MLVREVMTSPVITVHRSDPVRRAIRLLYERNITAAPVVDDAGRLLGIVSEMDLLRGEFPPDPRTGMLRPIEELTEPPPNRVGDVMTADVVTVTESHDVTTAIGFMVDKKIKSLPVLREEAVVGIVSRRDLMGVLARSDERLRTDVVATLRAQYPFGPHWDVEVRDGIAELRGHATEHTDRIADLLAHTVPGVVRVRHFH